MAFASRRTDSKGRRLLVNRPAQGGAPAATAYTLTGPASGSVGVASAVFTVQSNGALASAVMVTPSDGGGGGSFTPSTATMAIGTNTSATFTYTAGSAGTKTISTTNGGGLTNPASRSYTASAVVTGGTIQSFAVRNWGASASPGLLRGGVMFTKGDVPANSVPVLSKASVAVPAQFDACASWTDGSLKFAVMHMRDADFTVSESRSYGVAAVIGSRANAGSLTLAAAISGHDFKVNFANFTQYNDSTTVTRGSGSFTASMASHAAVATRVTKVHSGPVCDGWSFWGMATDNTGGAADAHLKVIWHVDAWKDAGGAITRLEVVPELAQDWWSIPGKLRLNYDAVFLDGSTTIAAFSGVQHFYHSHWLMCRSTADNNIGRRHWMGGSIPTLNYKPDLAYQKTTKVIPPQKLSDPTPPPLLSTLPTYVPLSSQNHRADIDGTGDYMGRGPIPKSDAIALMSQNPFDVAVARVNGHVGLHAPYRFRSNRTRTRPGEAADTANTVISWILDPKTLAEYDFTADGMPVPVYAFGPDPRSAAEYTDGYVGPQGGFGPWNYSSDSSHAVSYSFGMYLLEGESYHLEACLDNATSIAHRLVSNYLGLRPLFLANDSAYAALNIPTTIWCPTVVWKPDNVRAMGWAMLIMGHGAGIVPDDHVAARSVKALNSHVGDYCQMSSQYMPASQIGAGQFRAFAGGSDQYGVDGAPWMLAINGMGAYYNYLLTEVAGYKTAGDICANWTLGVIGTGAFYTVDAYRNMTRPLAAPWDASTNDFFQPSAAPVFGLFPNVVASNPTITLGDYWNAVNQRMTLTNGDKIYFAHESASSVIPPEFAAATPYYVINVTNPTWIAFDTNTGANSPTIQLAATPGGAAITPSANYVGRFGWIQQAAHATVATDPPYIPVPDNYEAIHLANAVFAQSAGNPAATTTLLNAFEAFMGPVAGENGPPWNLSMAD